MLNDGIIKEKPINVVRTVHHLWYKLKEDENKTRFISITGLHAEEEVLPKVNGEGGFRCLDITHEDSFFHDVYANKFVKQTTLLRLPTQSELSMIPEDDYAAIFADQKVLTMENYTDIVDGMIHPVITVENSEIEDFDDSDSSDEILSEEIMSNALDVRDTRVKYLVLDTAITLKVPDVDPNDDRAVATLVRDHLYNVEVPEWSAAVADHLKKFTSGYMNSYPASTVSVFCEKPTSVSESLFSVSTRFVRDAFSDQVDKEQFTRCIKEELDSWVAAGVIEGFSIKGTTLLSGSTILSDCNNKPQKLMI